MRRLPVVGRRVGSTRDRRGRGRRGPLVLPGPLSPAVDALGRSRRDEFDELVRSLVEHYVARWSAELDDVEFGTEDVPRIPSDWADEPVPFGALSRAAPGSPARIVVFRRPVEMRAKTKAERIALVNEVLVEHIADLLGRDPSEIDG
ncbi:MAG TPA: metallopeptidase family protein [Nocardioidaceae bacterium]|nr:metallopeptidase family protein [Nocardioidaceae bacterium]